MTVDSLVSAAGVFVGLVLVVVAAVTLPSVWRSWK